MTKKKLSRLRRGYRKLRANSANLRSRELASLAKKLERRRSHTRTNEPSYVSDAFPNARPIFIPSHSGKTMKRGTANNILDDLEGDLIRWQEYLDAQESDTQEPNE